MSESEQLHSNILVHLRKKLPGEDMRRLQVLAWAVTGLLLEKTINISLWVLVVSGEVLAASRERRFRRWLHNRHVDVRAFYSPFIREALAEWAGRRLYLALDCSTIAGRWTMLKISLVYRGWVVTVAWLVLGPTANIVPLNKYRDLLHHVATLLPAGCEVVLLADRGFRDTKLMKCLRKELNWHFRIRLIKSTTVTLPDGKTKALRDFRLDPGEMRFLQQVTITAQHYPVNLAFAWDPKAKDDPWYIATDELASPASLDEYGLRFDVEEGFLDDKSNGFQLEATQLNDPNAISRLLLIMALTTLYVTALGTEVVASGARRFIDTHWRRGLSYFQIGWRALRQAVYRASLLFSSWRLSSEPDPFPVRHSSRAFTLFADDG